MEFLRKFYKDGELPFLWHYTQQPLKPLQPESLFEIKGEKLILEIGCGKGIFLCQYALNFPQNCILGAEWDAYCSNLTEKKIAKLGLKNAAVMRGDLFYFLRDLMPTASIDEVHIYFPDPWPKQRHHKKRLILREGFLEQIYRTLKPGKRLFHWATDHEEYNALALKAFRNFPNAEILEENNAKPTYSIETGFEKKYKKEGRIIYRSIVEFSKP
jgi:tRNA (guanine-N7-)-methyltransferase